MQTAEQKEKERRSSKRWSAAEIEQLIAGTLARQVFVSGQEVKVILHLPNRVSNGLRRGGAFQFRPLGSHQAALWL